MPRVNIGNSITNGLITVGIGLTNMADRLVRKRNAEEAKANAEQRQLEADQRRIEAEQKRAEKEQIKAEEKAKADQKREEAKNPINKLMAKGYTEEEAKLIDQVKRNKELENAKRYAEKQKLLKEALGQTDTYEAEKISERTSNDIDWLDRRKTHVDFFLREE